MRSLELIVTFFGLSGCLGSDNSSVAPQSCNSEIPMSACCEAGVLSCRVCPQTSCTSRGMCPLGVSPAPKQCCPTSMRGKAAGGGRYCPMPAIICFLYAVDHSILHYDLHIKCTCLLHICTCQYVPANIFAMRHSTTASFPDLHCMLF